MSNHTFERNYLVTTTASLDWEALDDRAVDTIRGLAMDAVQKVGNGHPGTAMSLAPAAYLLFQKVMRHDPSDPKWIARDRFVLSCGHSSLTLYAQLFLGGFGLELDDIKALRTWDSLTPGHPEYGHTAGVETTTGPLGQGVANAIGMAMAARHQRGLLDPNTAEASIFDHFVYVLCSDGDLQEGVSAEASSIAGVQQLGNLVVIYDDNRISIEDDTAITFAEDVSKRYEAYGWHVQDVDWTNGGTELPRRHLRALRRHPGSQGRDNPAQLHQPPHDHCLARPKCTGHRKVSRLRAGDRGGRSHQADHGDGSRQVLRGRSGSA
jgi:transketolase